MTSEPFFRAAIDAEPENMCLRWLFSEWLADRGDWRAHGFRWMCQQGKWPFWLPSSRRWSWTNPENTFPYHNHLPRELYDLLPEVPDSEWKKYVTLQEAEEALCRIMASGTWKMKTEEIEQKETKKIKTYEIELKETKETKKT